MSKGWKEVARVGASGARYPHVLVDAHGWCLRLGPNPRRDEKYYSSLPLLLHGLVEHGARRRLLSLSAALALGELRREVKDALHSALGLCSEILGSGGQKEHVRRWDAREGSETAPGSPRIGPARPSSIHAMKGLVSNRHVV